MPAVRRLGCDASRRSGSIQRNAEQIALRRVRRRGAEVGRVRVDAGEIDDVGVEVRQQRRLPVARHPIEVPPAVALAEPQERAPAVHPVHVVLHVDPSARLGAGGIVEHAGDAPGRGIRQQIVVLGLQAIELLHRHSRRVDPLDTGDVGVARIAGHPKPRGHAAARGDDPHCVRRSSSCPASDTRTRSSSDRARWCRRSA